MSNENDTVNRPRSGKPAKSRNFVGVLYEDDPTHVRALEELQQLAGEWWFIRHDLDVKDDGTGEVKKPHWHVVLRLQNARSHDSLCAALGLAPNYLQVANSVSGAIRYLVHRDDPDKYQYSLDAIQTNSPGPVRRALATSQDDDKLARQIFDYIQSAVHCLSMSDISVWCFDNGCYSAFRRGYSVFRDVIREHNLMIKGDDLFG